MMSRFIRGCSIVLFILGIAFFWSAFNASAPVLPQLALAGLFILVGIVLMIFGRGQD